MKKLKHILALIIVLLVVVGGSVFVLPKLGNLELTKQDTASEAAQDTTKAEIDTLSFKDKLKQELQVIETSYSKRKKKDVWILGRGKSIINYLLEAQRFSQKQGGIVTYMEELHNDNALQSAYIDIVHQNAEDTLRLELQVSENIFKSNASVMAIAFQVKKLDSEMIVELNKLNFPFTLLIPPFEVGEGFYPDLDKVKEKEVSLWLTLESLKLDKRHNKQRPLRIHHTEEQIENIIDDAKNLLPQASGIVSRYGEYAVEHRQLLQAILRPAQKNKLWFLDATMNKRSKIEETCKDFNITCKKASYYNPENSTLSDYVKQRLRDARKNGISVMILPLDKESLKNIKDISQKSKVQGTDLVFLSKFMMY